MISKVKLTNYLKNVEDVDSHFAKGSKRIRIFHMKNASKAMCALIVTTSLLQAVGEDNVPGYRATYPENAIGMSTLTIVPKTNRLGRFAFADTNLLCNPTIYKNQEVKTCLLAGVRNVQMKLSNHLKSKSTNYGVLGLNATYDGVPDWSWVGGLTLQSAVTHFNLLTNTRYIGALVGRYAIKPNLGISVGAYAELGFRANIVDPLIGMDYTRHDWTLDVAYPIKAGLTYKGYAKQLFGVIVRPLYTAMRKNRGLGKSPAIATFQGNGLEFRYDFQPQPGFDFWCTLGKVHPTTSQLIFVVLFEHFNQMLTERQQNKTNLRERQREREERERGERERERVFL